MELVRYTGSADWSALYVDGKLDKVGDHWLIDERISRLLQVTEISSDDFLCGGDSRENVAPTLEALKSYISQEQDAQVARLQNEIDALTAQKNALLGKQ